MKVPVWLLMLLMIWNGGTALMSGAVEYPNHWAWCVFNGLVFGAEVAVAYRIARKREERWWIR